MENEVFNTDHGIVEEFAVWLDVFVESTESTLIFCCAGWFAVFQIVNIIKSESYKLAIIPTPEYPDNSILVPDPLTADISAVVNDGLAVVYVAVVDEPFGPFIVIVYCVFESK